MNIKIIVVYHSGYGHTRKVAEYIVTGASSYKNTEVLLIDVEELKDQDWDKLDAAHAIIFGAPTYMGSISAKFKIFLEEASKKWAQRKWLDKIAAGFTNSGSLSGDKQTSLNQLMINAMQHGMIWVGQAELSPQNAAPSASDVNRLGSWSGLMTQANQKEGPATAPPFGDLETAKIFGLRVASITARFNSLEKSR